MFDFSEQEEIAKGKQRGEFLTWEDLAKMFPPIFGGFRKALKDIEYGRYVIPEGWQVSENLEPSFFSAILSSLPLLLIIPSTDTLLIPV